MLFLFFSPYGQVQHKRDKNRLKNRLHVNPSEQTSSSLHQVLSLRKSGRIPTQLNPSAQQRSGGYQAHLNPVGPKRSPKIKLTQSSAVQQSSKRSSNYLNFPVKTRSRLPNLKQVNMLYS